MKNQVESDIFRENIELWSREDPKKALMLPYHDCSGVEFCTTDKGEKNLFRFVSDQKKYYHAQKGALNEAMDWISKLPEIQKYSIIYIYGVGLGYYYDALIPWLNEIPDRFLVFLEDDLSVIYRLFQTDRGKVILSDPRVKLLYFENLKDEEATLEVMYWNFAMKKPEIFPLKLYSEIKSREFSELKYKITYDAEKKNALVDEYLKYGVGFFKNFYPNMLRLADSSWGNALFGKFKNIPAIICGAGPSLEKQLPLLKKLKSQAIIFAGGSSLKALQAGDILPHLAAAIDPNPTQIDRLSTEAADKVPFFYRNRLNHEAFKLIHAPKLYISGVGGYDVADYYEELFDIKEEFFDEGHNVINFILQIAAKLGCNPVIFVGMDLAFTNGQAYSIGIVKDRKEELNDLAGDEKLERKDIYGNPVLTEWKWIAEADWIGQFADEHPEMTILNCTEGGIGFPNVKNETLLSVVDEYLNRHHNIEDRIASELTKTPFKSVTHEKIQEATKELKQSLLRCIEGFNVIHEDSMNIIRSLNNDHEIPSSLQGGMAALAEVEIEEEIAYKYILDIFNAVYSGLLNNELHRLKIESTKLSEPDKIRKKLELNAMRIKFLIDVADLNVQLIDLAVNTEVIS